MSVFKINAYNSRWQRTSVRPVQLILLKEDGMKAIAIATLLATVLGGCVVVPLGYRHYGDGYYRGGYYRGDYYRGDRYYRGDGYRGYGYGDRGG
jgi:hypothetical protein